MGKTLTSVILGLLFMLIGCFVFFKYIFADNKNESSEVNNLINNQIAEDKGTDNIQDYSPDEISIDSKIEERENFQCL